MLFKNYCLTSVFYVCSLVLSAQTIDLGGESPAVGPLKPPPVSQVAEPLAWMKKLLQKQDDIKMSLSIKDKDLANQTIRGVLKIMRSLRQEQKTLEEAYQNYKHLLSEQEVIFFEWLLRSGNRLIAELGAPLMYLNAVNELPLNQTNYAQLYTLIDLLEQTSKRFGELPYYSEARTVLRNISTQYFNEVNEANQLFQQLKSR